MEKLKQSSLTYKEKVLNTDKFYNDILDNKEFEKIRLKSNKEII